MYLAHNIDVTLEEFYNGSTRSMAHSKRVVCDVCEGTGANREMAAYGEQYELCEVCDGVGTRPFIITTNIGTEQLIDEYCGSCSGRGYVNFLEDRCRNCGGRSTCFDHSIVQNVQIRRGMRHNQRIIHEGEGCVIPDSLPGNVFFILKEVDHPVFKRQGDDLFMKMRLELVEALCGFEKEIKTLDDRRLVVRSPLGNVIQDKGFKCIMAEGMPKYRRPNEKGNLIIQFEVNYPSTIHSSDLPYIEQCLPSQQPIDISFKAIDCNLVSY